MPHLEMMVCSPRMGRLDDGVRNSLVRRKGNEELSPAPHPQENLEQILKWFNLMVLQ